MRKWPEHQHLTASKPHNNPRDDPSSVPGSSAPGLVYSSGYSSKITSDNPAKDLYPVLIINPTSAPSETPTKYNYHVTKKLSNSKPSNMLIKYPSGYPVGAPSTMPT